MVFQDDQEDATLDPSVDSNSLDQAQLLANQICGSLDGCMIVLRSFEESDRQDYLAMITSVLDSLSVCRMRANGIVNLLDGMPEDL